uniref:protein NRT1/ PTR FAMILY 5.5-like n=1 Tax=Erigeron canadensis TaxID=72917 RepID=UPI001CB98A36|nr:protein NRT1/ PTR FAMILY 5.5-like [Erigeron canadensis]
MASFVRISVLSWADILATFAMYLMMTYLTNVWNLSTTHAAGIINIWNGITPVLAIIFAFFVDEFIGDFNMLVLSSISYSIGLGLLTMSTPPVFGPCSDYKEKCIGYTQKVLFYTALPLIAVGMAGHLASFSPFLDLQTKREHEEGADESSKKFWQIMGLMMVVVVPYVAGFAVQIIKPWSIRFGIPAICTLVATVIFLSGFREYRHINPGGSPLKTTLRVFVATARNISRPNPNPEQLNNEEDARLTNSLSCLNKAAIKLPEEQQSKKWKVCSVHEVEDTKICIRMVRMWLAFIVIGMVLSIGNTYFLEQANHMDHKLGKIKVPTIIFLLFHSFTRSICASLYSYFTKRLANKKYVPPVGIATSMVFSVLCCITAAKVETRRLDRIRDNGLLDKPDATIPMSIFALLPQFMLLAAVDGIGNRSINSFFMHQTPQSMHKYLGYFTKGVLGLGSMASVLSVYIVGKVSERNQKPNWFQFSLNRSHLDRYYWVLAALSAANILVYIIIALFYKYKEPPTHADAYDDDEDEDEDEYEEDEVEEDDEEDEAEDEDDSKNHSKCCC